MLESGQERLQTSGKENNDNVGQCLNIDNLPEGTSETMRKLRNPKSSALHNRKSAVMFQSSELNA